MADRRYSLVNHTHDLDELVGSDNVALLDESNVFLGNVMTLSSTDPRIRWFETNASTNNSLWDIISDGEQFKMRVLNDLGSSATNWLVVDRTLNVVDQIALAATSITANGSEVLTAATGARLSANNTFTGDTLQISNIAPRVQWSETDAGTDEKIWRALASGDSWRLDTLTDAGGLGSTPIKADRTGTHVDSLSLTADTITANGRLDIIQAAGGATTDYLHLRDNTSTNDLFIRYNGAGAWVFNSESGGGGTEFLRFVTSGAVLFPNGSSSLPGITFTSDSNTGFRWSSSGTMFVVSDAFDLAAFAPSGLHMFNPIYIAERSAPQSDVAGRGQLWVKNTTPCQLWFTDDTGVDHQIT